ncbi:GntR family transcriptional regulator [Planktomarina sp.]|nr:GntR family transcriptional regulator [Planktomarina sp.]
MPKDTQTWQSVRDEVQRRINTRIWPAGMLLPTETDLAAELGCARVTVNRALRDLADQGLLHRKRKAGTRVAEFPIRNVHFTIPIIGVEIESLGQIYSYSLLSRLVAPPPAPIQAALGLEKGRDALHLKALHLADGCPFVLEDRWVNLGSVPDAAQIDFNEISANEWLVGHAGFSHGEFSFSAHSLSQKEAENIGASVGASVLQTDRQTWDGDVSITRVSLIYAPGHRLRSTF